MRVMRRLVCHHPDKSAEMDADEALQRIFLPSKVRELTFGATLRFLEVSTRTQGHAACACVVQLTDITPHRRHLSLTTWGDTSMKYTARAVFNANQMLRHLDAAGMERVTRVAVRRSYTRGEKLFAQGDPGDAIFGVIAGRVQITARTSANQEIFLDFVSSGGILGEIAVIDGLPRLVSAVAATSVEAFRICRDSFTRLMAADPLLSLGLLDLLCRRQRFVTRLIIDEYSQGHVSARLANRILRLTSEQARADPADQSLRITQAELAKYVFASRQVVNQHLSDWVRHGWVSIARRSLVVTDREALTEIARNNGHSSGNGAAPETPLCVSH
jgi:CRP-like cAMP-binding protein